MKIPAVLVITRRRDNGSESHRIFLKLISPAIIQLVNEDDEGNDKDAGINQFVIPCQPFRQENIEVRFLRRRILPSHQRNWTYCFKCSQHQSFSKHKSYA